MSKIVDRIEIHGIGNNLNLKINGFRYSPINVLVHLERLAGLKVISKKSWFLTDDFEAFFTYKGFMFVLETPFAEVEIWPYTKRTPEEITNEIFSHIKNYKPVWLYESAFKWVKYIALPFNPKH